MVTTLSEAEAEAIGLSGREPGHAPLAPLPPVPSSSSVYRAYQQYSCTCGHSWSATLCQTGRLNKYGQAVWADHLDFVRSADAIEYLGTVQSTRVRREYLLASRNYSGLDEFIPELDSETGRRSRWLIDAFHNPNWGRDFFIVCRKYNSKGKLVAKEPVQTHTSRNKAVEAITKVFASQRMKGHQVTTGLDATALIAPVEVGTKSTISTLIDAVLSPPDTLVGLEELISQSELVLQMAPVISAHLPALKTKRLGILTSPIKQEEPDESD